MLPHPATSDDSSPAESLFQCGRCQRCGETAFNHRLHNYVHLNIEKIYTWHTQTHSSCKQTGSQHLAICLIFYE